MPGESVFKPNQVIFCLKFILHIWKISANYGISFLVNFHIGLIYKTFEAQLNRS